MQDIDLLKNTLKEKDRHIEPLRSYSQFLEVAVTEENKFSSEIEDFTSKKSH